MDGPNAFSAIDDCGPPVHFSIPISGGPPPSCIAGRDYSPLTDEHPGTSGPRSGHWSVSSNVPGSAIDGRCPTEHYLPHSLYASGQPVGNAKRIQGSLLRKLARATVEAKDTDQDAVDVQSGYETHMCFTRNEYQSQASEPSRPPKELYVPRMGKSRAPGVKTRDQPLKIVARRFRTDWEQKPRCTTAKPENIEDACASPPHSSSMTKKVCSNTPLADSPLNRDRVRVRGSESNVEIAQLPFISARSIQTPHQEYDQLDSAPPGEEKQQSIGSRRTERERNRNRVAKKEQDQRAAEAAQQLRNERIEIENARAAEISAGAMMSGALPPPSGRASRSTMYALHPASASGKDSGVAFTNMFAERKASSKVLGNGSRQSSEHQTAHGFQQTSEQRSKPLSDRKGGGEGWKEVGAGSTRPAVWDGNENHNWDTRRSKTTSHRSKQSSETVPAQSHPHRESSATIFAGRGWISPHPLSTIASEAQSAIEIPARNGVLEGGGKMTHEEWKGVQRRQKSFAPKEPEQFKGEGGWDVSKEDAGPEAIQDADWDGNVWRTGSKAASLKSGYSKSRARGGGLQYQTPLVESVRESQRSASRRSRQSVVHEWGKSPQDNGNWMVDNGANTAKWMSRNSGDGGRGWDVYPVPGGLEERYSAKQFDGTDDTETTEDDEGAAYRERLHNLVEHYQHPKAATLAPRTRVRAVRGTDDSYHDCQKVQLRMPWDPESSINDSARSSSNITCGCSDSSLTIANLPMEWQESQTSSTYMTCTECLDHMHATELHESDEVDTELDRGPLGFIANETASLHGERCTSSCFETMSDIFGEEEEGERF